MISLRDVVTGFGNRDPLAEVWRRDLRSGGSAEITGTLPLRYIGNGKPLTDYMIYGNTVQNGAPSPKAPVDVVGCGVRTENLVEFFDTTITVFNVNIKVEKQNVTFSGTASGNGGRLFPISKDIVLEPGVYSFETLGGGQRPSAILQSKTNSSKYYFSGTTITLESNETFFISFLFNAGREYNGNLKAMLNTGSTPLPYEPYGYKLPLTVNGTEYPIYFGQVPTTRKIKKLVLDGTENWKLSSTPNQFYIDSVLDAVPQLAPMCTHFKGVSGLSGDNQIVISASQKINIRTTHIQHDLTDWINYLQQQYAAGTPVTVWYILAEPETAIVNEPLMKIGDYADTISFAQAEVVIPTVNGANVLDMTSPVKPSEVYIKGKGIKPTNDPNFENGD